MSWSQADLESLPLLYATVQANTSGDGNEVVAAVTGKRILVMGYFLSCAGAVNLKWSTDTGGTPTYLTGLLYGTTNSGIAAAFSPGGWFVGTAGKNLGFNLSGGTAVGGSVVYVLV